MTHVQPHGETIIAYKLGAGSIKENELIKSRKLIQHDDGSYEILYHSPLSDYNFPIFLHAGDYLIEDAFDPVKYMLKDGFEERHIHIRDNHYKTIPNPIEAWNASEPLTAAVYHLITTGNLVLNFADRNNFFKVRQWWWPSHQYLYMDDKTTLIFPGIKYDENGTVTFVMFEIISPEDLTKNYTVLDNAQPSK